MLYALPTVDIKYEKITLKRNSYLFTISPQYYLMKRSSEYVSGPMQFKLFKHRMCMRKLMLAGNYFVTITRYVNHTIRLNAQTYT